MSRRYKKPIYRNKDKYSIENRIVQTNTVVNWDDVDATDTINSGKQTSFVIIPQTDVQGMRKCKHFTLTFTCAGNTGEFLPLYYALVYVPEGYGVNRVNIPKYATTSSVSPYEPNQFVISQGMLDFSGGPLRVRSPLSRNLNSGDSIWLVFAYSNAWGTPNTYGINATISYAISLQ